MNSELVSEALRVTGHGDIESLIVNEFYFTAADGAFGAKIRGSKIVSKFEVPEAMDRMMTCVIFLSNGLVATGLAFDDEGEASERQRRAKAREEAIRIVLPQVAARLSAGRKRDA